MAGLDGIGREDPRRVGRGPSPASTILGNSGPLAQLRPAVAGPRSTRSRIPGKSSPPGSRHVPAPAGYGRPSRPSRSTPPRPRGSWPLSIGAHWVLRSSGDLKVLSAGQVLLEEVIRGAGNVAADLVERFADAAIPLRRARIDQQARSGRRALSATSSTVSRQPGRGAPLKLPGGRRLDAAAHGMPFALPAREPAVEHRHRVVPHPAQHPPQAGRHTCRCRRRRPPPACRARCPRSLKRAAHHVGVGQRMPAVGAGLRCRTDGDRGARSARRDVASRYSSSPFAGSVEIEAAVDHDPVRIVERARASVDGAIRVLIHVTFVSD